jgi:hypothetical protein
LNATADDSRLANTSFQRRRRNRSGMDSFLSALFGAETGRLQLGVAAYLARTDPSNPLNPDVGPQVAQLADAAQQSMQPLANAASHLGTNLDITC